jgi:hypothetical protein
LLFQLSVVLALSGSPLLLWLPAKFAPKSSPNWPQNQPKIGLKIGPLNLYQNWSKIGPKLAKNEPKIVKNFIESYKILPKIILTVCL